MDDNSDPGGGGTDPLESGRAQGEQPHEGDTDSPWPTEQQAAADSQAHCSVHPQAPAEAACDHCGNFSCAACLRDTHNKRVCQSCVDAGHVSLGRTPWENREELGWLQGLWQTIKQVTVSPVAFFNNIEPTSRLPEAAGFAFLVAIPGSIVGAAMQFLIGGVTAILPLLGIDSPAFPTSTETDLQLLSSGAQAVFVLIFGAPMAVLGAVISACIHHLGLLIVGGGDKGLEGSVKGALYASAVHFWACIPLFKFVTDVWMMVLQGVAYCFIHRNPGWKGAFAVLYASCICIFAACGIGFLVALMIGAAGSSGFNF